MGISFSDAPVVRTRPSGIRTLAMVCFLLAAYLLVSGVLVSLAMLSLYAGRVLLGDYVTMGPTVYLGTGLGFVVLGIGLLRGWPGFRRLGIVAAAVLMATSILPVSVAVTYFQILPLVVHGLKIILAVMAIRYLLQANVVEFFSARGAPRST